MPDQTESLGGRLPLLDPKSLTGAQQEAYDHLRKTSTPWAASVPFQSQTHHGRYIGPFNPVLYSHEISLSFFAWQEAEGKHTTLNQRVRQVVILTVGAVWECDYERYAHAAVARKAGIPEAAVAALVRGEPADGLDDQERLAQRFTRQLTAERRIDDRLYREAEAAFGARGIVDIVYLAGCYDAISSLLNAFEVPAPD